MSARHAIWLPLALAIVLVACRRSAPSGAARPSTTPSTTASAAASSGLLLAGADTYGVLVGVLSFGDTSITSFSDELRKDVELSKTLAARGVLPANLTLLLDREATSAKVLGALRDAAARAPAGSTLVFYYAGHGARDAKGRPYFLAYDTKAEKNALFIDAIGESIAQSFRGKRVILMGDCCYSGTLKAAAETLAQKRGLETVSLTSADASNLSTENWTFTQTIIDGLGGDAFADSDRDGKITLGELADEVASAMKFRETQRHGFWAKGVALETPVARSSARPASKDDGVFRSGAYVRARHRQKRAVARIRELGQEDALVRYYDYNRAEDVRVPVTALEALKFERYDPGSALKVFWGGKVWDAKVVRTEGDFHFITYPGWPAYWDEWILSDRIFAGETASAAGAGAVEVEWRGRWYPAVVLERAGDRTLIHYVGYETSWDEWVSPDRIRPR